MADKNPTSESDSNKKRNRSEISSTSSVDASMSTTPIKNPKKKQNKHSIDKESDQTDLIEIRQQLRQINDKLANVLTKDDGNIRAMMKEMITQMKEELLKSVVYRLDILEGNLFTKDQENDKLKEHVKSLGKTVDEQGEENNNLRYKLRKSEEKTEEFLNEVEQYSRSNNVRISGIAEKTYPVKQQPGKHQISTTSEQVNNNNKINHQDETQIKLSVETENLKQISENADQTTDIVIKYLNQHIADLNLKREDIDISHRLGKKSGKNPRQIIIRFMSRLTRDKLLRSKKALPKPIFVMEDLTKTNHQVLMCVKNKMPDEVEFSWTRNGAIYYKNKAGYIQRVHSREYGHWLNLPWL